LEAAALFCFQRSLQREIGKPCEKSLEEQEKVDKEKRRFVCGYPGKKDAEEKVAARVISKGREAM